MNKRATHTPGPWHTALLPNTVIARPCPGDDAVAVASVGGRSRDECDANARLIATAPEMAGALRDLLDVLDSHCKDFRMLVIAEYGIARALLARIDGPRDA